MGLTLLVQERRPECLRVHRAELEDVTDLDRGLEAEPSAAHRAAVALDRLPDVGEPGREVPPVLDTAKVPSRPVRARDELALAEGVVGHDLAGEADGAE